MKLPEVASLILWEEDEDGYCLVAQLVDLNFRITLGYMHWLEDICGS